MKTFEQVAEAGYKAYCKRAGGVTFDGKPIPMWENIGEERQGCWIACAAEVLAQGAASLYSNMMAELQSDVAAIDLSSVKTSSPNQCATVYHFGDKRQDPTTRWTNMSDAVFAAGGGGDFGGAGASASFSDNSSSDGGSSSNSDSSSSSGE